MRQTSAKLLVKVAALVAIFVAEEEEVPRSLGRPASYAVRSNRSFVHLMHELIQREAIEKAADNDTCLGAGEVREQCGKAG